jgi:methylenetetrahydrofolate reductase (NADPH)
MSDLTGIFLRYLQSAIPTTPFSSEPLSAESKLILPHLIELTSRGFWTVGSQPATDGAPSEDSIVGWGPRRGYVFQKSFVEFFCPESVVQKIQDKAVLEGGGWVSWFAARDGKEIRSNVPKDGRNAVTWGVFPGQEVAQSTIIEKESFLSWKVCAATSSGNTLLINMWTQNEAFSIWAAWASFYPPGSEERHLLESVRETRWLVNIVHHDYRNSKALWSFLFDGLTLETGTPS